MAQKVRKTSNPRVFVYGTLKSGQPNHPALEGARFLGPARLYGTYTLVDMGWYPAIINSFDPNDPKKNIYGEVYEINDDILHTLDLIEGHPNYYTRLKVETPYKKAWCYFLPTEYLNTKAVIEEGIWRPTPDERQWMEQYANGI